MENLKNYDENRIFISENKKSIVVYDRNTGNLHYTKDKKELADIINQIMAEPEKSSIFVKDEENVFKLSMSTTCNLNCDYCFRDKGSHIQTDVTKAKKIIDYIVDELAPHVWMYSFSVNLTSESLVELEKIREIKRYIDERTSPTYTKKDFKSLEDAKTHLACFPNELVENPFDYQDVESIVELLNSFLKRKDMVSFFPLPEGMVLPEWEAERFRNLKNLSGYSLMEFNLRFLECLFPETFLRKPHYAFYICTNGTIFNENVVDFFREINLDTVCISLDGPSGVHNKHRFFNDNKATHEIIVENIKKFKAAGLKVSVAAVITADFPFPLQLVEYFKQLNIDAVDLNAVRTGSEASFDESSIERLIEGYKELFERIFTDALNNDYSLVDLLKDCGIFSGIRLLLAKNRIIKRCKWNENTIFDNEGDIYPCDYFIGKRAYLRGNILSSEIKDVGNGKLLVDERGNCKDCWCKYLCGGTCFYNSLKNTGDISLPDPVECKFNKEMRILSIQFVQKLIDAGIDLFEFGKKIGVSVDKNIMFEKEHVVQNGITCSICGTLTRIEMEIKEVFKWLNKKHIAYENDIYISVLGIADTRSNKILNVKVIIPIYENLWELDERLKNKCNCKIVRDFNFGKNLLVETVSAEADVEKARNLLYSVIQGYKIPVKGTYWYKGSLEAFLGYKNESISVFYQRMENVY